MSGVTSKARRKWLCDVCKKEDYWDDSWSWYGSISHMETCPDDLICACSPDCAKIAKENIDSGEWQLPQLSMRGPHCNVVKPRIGY